MSTVKEQVKEQVEELIASSSVPQRTHKLKRNTVLLAQVNEYYGKTLVEKMYTVVNGDSHLCAGGKERKFLTFDRGYELCGAVCSCNVVEKAPARMETPNETIEERRVFHVEVGDMSDQEATELLERVKVELTETIVAESVQPTIENHAMLYNNDEVQYVHEVPVHVEETLRESTKIRFSKKTGLPKG